MHTDYGGWRENRIALIGRINYYFFDEPIEKPFVLTNNEINVIGKAAMTFEHFFCHGPAQLKILHVLHHQVCDM